MKEQAQVSPDFLRGGGELGRRMREVNWASTALGPVDTWPDSLRTALGILLNSGYPMYIAWGDQFVQFYNDAYRSIMGTTKHPGALGARASDTFSEIWETIGPMFGAVMQDGTPSTYTDLLLPLDRHGYAEECYFTFSYSAIPNEADGVGGVFVTALETTGRVVRERRMQALRRLAEIRARDSLSAICAAGAAALGADRADAPFVLMYSLDANGGMALAGTAGVPPDHPLMVNTGNIAGAAIAGALGTIQRVELANPLTGVPDWPEAVTSAACITVAPPGQAQARALLVVGLSPRLPFDAGYEEFIGSAAAHLAALIAEAESYAHERRRAEALAELDRAKTVFFSDVSHEFRTPLTLMMGPISEALSSATGEQRDLLLTAQRNALRLQKLVNTLLDFSRIEAGRLQADMRPVYLETITADLASLFRSAIERAGLEFEVDCPPLGGMVAVDTDMWEKVVLNLLSNAFKHTFKGSIRVALRERAGQIELTVSDTGVGIPASEQKHVFERFRRVSHARSRTHEGSGIGLALVQELVRLHEGTISLDSREGEGSTFVVTMPRRHATDTTNTRLPSTAIKASVFVEEALRWLPDSPSADIANEPEVHTKAQEPGLVLVADDNADMREYVRRLVAGRWTVETCADGESALQFCRSHRVDALVSDITMPRIDGFQLLATLKADPGTAHIPVMLLSARAGDDARVDGIRAGADDYLVKPFVARDLVARVGNLVLRSQLRLTELGHASRLARIFENAPVAIALLRGPEHEFELANAPYLELVGPRVLVGKPVREALPELRDQGIFELLDQVYQSGKPYLGRALRLMLNRRGGAQLDECFFDFVYQPIPDAQGRVEGIAVVAFEVTELFSARREAEAASHAKDEFLAMLGHDLRNPLAPILTALQLMRMRGADAVQKERQIIERQVQHLVGLVDDLLDVSRITRGKMALLKERIELATAVAKGVEMAAPLLQEREHQLSLSIPEKGLLVDADPRRLAQVIGNLLNNAAKYTELRGSIEIWARREGAEVIFGVRDSGVGIDQRRLSKIFDVFYQAPQAMDRSMGGLGIGLAIVRSIVSQHGGKVTANSAGLGRGSEFCVTLPLAQGEVDRVARGSDALPASLLPKRILVVDDNVDAARTLALLLKERGHETRFAHDGPAALSLVKAFHPEVAIVDLGLPVMDGFELARQIRLMPDSEDLRLLALTGYGLGKDREQSRRAGFQAHLVKPVRVEQIETAIVQCG